MFGVGGFRFGTALFRLRACVRVCVCVCVCVCHLELFSSSRFSAGVVSSKRFRSSPVPSSPVAHRRNDTMTIGNAAIDHFGFRWKSLSTSIPSAELLQ